MTDCEKEQLCRLMDCQKLSLDASSHAAQNEMLPLRVIVQVLFFEQLRLRTSISSWFFVDNVESSRNPSGNLGLPKIDGSRQMVPVQDRVKGDGGMKERVSELEKEYFSMKEALQKIVITKKSWKTFAKRLVSKQKSQLCNPKESKRCSLKEQAFSGNGKQNHNNAEVVH